MVDPADEPSASLSDAAHGQEATPAEGSVVKDYWTDRSAVVIRAHSSEAKVIL